MLDINAANLNHWRLTGYSASDVDELCKALDKTYLAARVVFSGENAPPSFTVTNRTGESGAGHYPTLIAVINEVWEEWEGPKPSGSVAILLEDGIFPGLEQFVSKAPLLNFGTSCFDHYSLLIPDPGFWGTAAYQAERAEIDELESSIKWSDKKEVLFWRGASSGLGMNGPAWKEADRIRVSLKCKELADERFDAYLSKIVDYGYEESSSVPYELGIVRDYVHFSEFLNYKHLLDVDGISCAWYSCFLKLYAKSTLVKVQSPCMQWYYDRLKPWVHYVPISSDLQDVPEVLDWLQHNDDACKQIAEQGRELAASLTIEKEKKALELLLKELLACQRG